MATNKHYVEVLCSRAKFDCYVSRDTIEELIAVVPSAGHCGKYKWKQKEAVGGMLVPTSNNIHNLGVDFSVQGSSSVPVAIKVLKDKREEARRTLLQEAALMGQFCHKNVVKLCGVVTEGEPVSYDLIFTTSLVCFV